MTEVAETETAAAAPAQPMDEKTTRTTGDNATEDKTAAAPAATTEETPAAPEAATEAKPIQATAGEKRKADDAEEAEKSSSTTTTTTSTAADAPASKPKKAKIAMPPSVSSSITDVEKYKLESPPPADNTNQADVEKKITTANLMLFGLHPLIREGPLQKMLGDYGTVKAITVRSAFASRYGHVSFETVEEARKCYVAIHGAKLLHKSFLVQPSMAAAPAPSAPKPAPATAGAAAAATAAAAAAAATSGEKTTETTTKDASSSATATTTTVATDSAGAAAAAAAVTTASS